MEQIKKLLGWIVLLGAILQLTGCALPIQPDNDLPIIAGYHKDYVKEISSQHAFGAVETSCMEGQRFFKNFDCSSRNLTLTILTHCYKDSAAYIEFKPFCDDPDNWGIIPAKQYWGPWLGWFIQHIPVPKSVLLGPPQMLREDVVEWIEPEYDANGRALTPRKFVRIVQRGFTDTCGAPKWMGQMPTGSQSWIPGWVECEGWSAKPLYGASLAIASGWGFFDPARPAIAPSKEVQARMIQHLLRRDIGEHSRWWRRKIEAEGLILATPMPKITREYGGKPRTVPVEVVEEVK